MIHGPCLSTGRCLSLQCAVSRSEQLRASPHKQLHQVPFKNSPHRTSTEPWRTHPLRSSLSLVEGRLFSTLSLRMVASPAWLWPGILEGKRSRDNFFVIFDCFGVAFELVRGAQFTRNQAYSLSAKSRSYWRSCRIGVYVYAAARGRHVPRRVATSLGGSSEPAPKLLSFIQLTNSFDPDSVKCPISNGPKFGQIYLRINSEPFQNPQLCLDQRVALSTRWLRKIPLARQVEQELPFSLQELLHRKSATFAGFEKCLPVCGSPAAHTSRGGCAVFTSWLHALGGID